MSEQGDQPDAGDPRDNLARHESLFYVRPVRGNLVAQTWPQQPTERHPTQEWWQEWFRQANLLAKYAPPIQQHAARKATEGTPWMPRDLFLKAMRGRLWSIALDDGRVLYSVAANQDVSERLDIISQTVGSIIVRADGQWVALTPGPAGYLLASQGEGSMPVWVDPNSLQGTSLAAGEGRSK